MPEESRLATSLSFSDINDERDLSTDGENQVTHFTDEGNEGRRRIKCLGRHTCPQCPDHQAIMEINLQREMACKVLP